MLSQMLTSQRIAYRLFHKHTFKHEELYHASMRQVASDHVTPSRQDPEPVSIRAVSSSAREILNSLYQGSFGCEVIEAIFQELSPVAEG
jgi:hypothetical protein